MVTSLERVFAATSSSEAGKHAARFAEQLAREHQAGFRIFTVESTGLGGPAPVPEAAGHPGPLGEVWSAWGIPAIEIVRAAETWGADLVVLGRRERRDEDALGATVEAVVRRRAGPCLLIPRGIDKVEHMLLALDGTPRGQGILPFASMLAGTLGIRVSAVHVVPHALDLAPARQRLRHALERCLDLGGADILETREGDPVTAILEAARESHAGLLVVGVRRGGPPGDAGSGYVGRDLLRKAPTAILTIPI